MINWCELQLKSVIKLLPTENRAFSKKPRLYVLFDGFTVPPGQSETTCSSPQPANFYGRFRNASPCQCTFLVLTNMQRRKRSTKHLTYCAQFPELAWPCLGTLLPSSNMRTLKTKDVESKTQRSLVLEVMFIRCDSWIWIHFVFHDVLVVNVSEADGSKKNAITNWVLTRTSHQNINRGCTNYLLNVYYVTELFRNWIGWDGVQV